MSAVLPAVRGPKAVMVLVDRVSDRPDELRRENEELRRTNEELRRKLEEQRRFGAVAARGGRLEVRRACA